MPVGSASPLARRFAGLRAICFAIVATLVLLFVVLFAASLLAKVPFAGDHVFGEIHTGQLWSGKAHFIDDWYAVEQVDEASFIIGEPKSSQYNSSYLLVGKERALLIDAGSGERPANIRSMRALAESLSGKPVELMLSHFHFDHTGDLDAFDGALVPATPELQARALGARLRINATESLTGARDMRIERWIVPGGKIELGGRSIEVRSTPGHAQESVTFIDRERRLVFAGDLLYQHLGGLVAFLPGSDIGVYAEEIGKLLNMTGDGYRYFGAHGVPEFGAGWARRVHLAMSMLANDAVRPVLGQSYLVPGLPLAMYQQDQLLIYQPPVMPAKRLYARRTLVVLGAALALITAIFWHLFRTLEARKSTV
jgi:glyoxylase-like metal-dependent hydrolase (beta-lactamase superfamily II)